LPILFEGEVKAVMELSSVERSSPAHQAFLDQLTESIGIVLNTIEASTRTENLLKQSQSLATELQKPTWSWKRRRARTRQRPISGHAESRVAHASDARACFCSRVGE